MAELAKPITCGNNGGVTQNGKPCSYTEGGTYNDKSLVNFDSYGRCKYHPPDLLIDKTIQDLIDKNLILFESVEKGDIQTYVCRDGIWVLITSNMGFNFIKNLSSEHSRISKKDFIERVGMYAERGDIKEVSHEDFNNRDIIPYSHIAVEGDKIDLLDLDYERRRVNKSSINQYLITESFPRFIKKTGFDYEAIGNVKKLIDSFGGSDFLIFFSKYLFSPAKDMGIWLGVSDAGKTEFKKIIRSIFVKGGVGEGKLKNIGGQFDSVGHMLCQSNIVFLEEVSNTGFHVNWDGIYDFIGRDILSIELKGENTKEYRRIGNLIIIGNTPVYMGNTEFSAFKSRVGEQSVWIVGPQDLSNVRRFYSKNITAKKRKDWEIQEEDYLKAVDNIEKNINEVNEGYELPFGKVSKLDWKRSIAPTLISEDAQQYLLERIISAMEHILKNGSNVERAERYYNYFVDCSKIIGVGLGEENEFPKIREY